MATTKPAGYKFDKSLSEPYTSPRGRCRWPRLNSPDTQFAKPGEPGDFKIEVILTADDGAKLLDQIKGIIREATKAYKADTKKTPKLCDSLPVFPELDEDGNETGNMIFRAKVAAGYRNKDEVLVKRSVTIVDAKMKPVKPNVGSGSEVRVSATLHPFHNSGIGLGVRAQLEGVQVLKLVEFSGQRSPEQMGFEAEDDGYVGEEPMDTDAGSASGDAKDGL